MDAEDAEQKDDISFNLRNLGGKIFSGVLPVTASLSSLSSPMSLFIVMVFLLNSDPLIPSIFPQYPILAT